jgi:selT/selW/selH-like putative selenoprotein
VEAELKAKYPDSDIKLIKGGGGIFDVKCNGKLIYSKLNTKDQRFPDDGEISRSIGQGVS